MHTATRNDLGEESVIYGLAQSVGSVVRLNRLALLTWADSTATGPKALEPLDRKSAARNLFQDA